MTALAAGLTAFLAIALATGLTAFLITALAAGLTAFLATGLVAGLVTDFVDFLVPALGVGLALDGFLATGLVTDFTGFLTAGLAGFLTEDFGAGLADLAADLAAAFVLGVAFTCGLLTYQALHPQGVKQDSPALADDEWRADFTQIKHCSKPCMKISLGNSMPMNTILLMRGSPTAHSGPKSLPMSW